MLSWLAALAPNRLGTKPMDIGGLSTDIDTQAPTPYMFIACASHRFLLARGYAYYSKRSAGSGRVGCQTLGGTKTSSVQPNNRNCSSCNKSRQMNGPQGRVLIVAQQIA